MAGRLRGREPCRHSSDNGEVSKRVLLWLVDGIFWVVERRNMTCGKFRLRKECIRSKRLDEFPKGEQELQYQVGQVDRGCQSTEQAGQRYLDAV